MFPAKGAATAKGKRWELTFRAQGMARKLMWLEWMSHSMRGWWGKQTEKAQLEVMSWKR